MPWDSLPNSACVVKNVFAFDIRWVPESARWLIANGKLEQAQMYLKRCAKMNRTEESIDTLKPEVNINQMVFKPRKLQNSQQYSLGHRLGCLIHYCS